MTRLHQIIGIHGAPRSGTSWLGQLFNSSEHVAYRFQPFFSYAFKGRVSYVSDADDIDKFFGDLRETEDDFVLQRGAASLSGYDLQFHKTYITHLVYKEVRYHEVVENILEKCPRFRAIGIVRHPCAVIHSWLNAPREFDHSLNAWSEWLDAPIKNHGHPENWYGYIRWKTLATLFDELSHRFPDRFSIVRYENLVAAPQETLGALFKTCQLPLSSQVQRFMQKSHERDDGEPYGVFRDGISGVSRWKDRLDKRIIDAIYADLRDSQLECYLAPSPIEHDLTQQPE